MLEAVAGGEAGSSLARNGRKKGECAELKAVRRMHKVVAGGEAGSSLCEEWKKEGRVCSVEGFEADA